MQYYLVALLLILIAALVIMRYKRKESFTDSATAPATTATAPATTVTAPATTATTETAPATTVTAPATSTCSTDIQMIKDIRQVVKDEISKNNAFTMNTVKSSMNQEIQNTPSLQQGSQFKSNPAISVCDSNEYIRKDSIPCNACTLDY